MTKNYKNVSTDFKGRKCNSDSDRQVYYMIWNDSELSKYHLK